MKALGAGQLRLPPRSTESGTHASRLRGRESGIHHRAQPIAGAKVQGPPSSLLCNLSQLAADNARLAALASELGLNCHTTAFEQQSGKQWSSKQRRILYFLGLDPEVDLRPKSVRLTPDELEIVVANHGELVRMLTNTPYGTFLDG